jgi:general L-amino acid transport system permease protein
LVRGFLIQAGLVICLASATSFFVSNAVVNLTKNSLTTGFNFLWSSASFELGESVTGFVAGDTFLDAFYAGIANTLSVSVISIVAATIIGILIGITRLSANPLARSLSGGYVELVRNIPLILQMMFWYAVITRSFPSPRQALRPVEGLFLSNRGINFPALHMDALHLWIAVGLTALLVVLLLLRRSTPVLNSQQRLAHVLRDRWLPLGLSVVILISLAVTATIEIPHLGGFRFRGGASISPEFTAVFFGLTIYSAAFIAENVRSGILGVSRGQREAAAALGLRSSPTMRLIILPQALRVVVPPLASQYLNIVKNSSLAVAVGYPDIMRVATIVISETGKAIEVIAIIMAIYLIFSLIISYLMNVYNRAVMAKGG